MAGELHYTNVNGWTNVTGDTNGDGQADFAISLKGTFTLISSDFLL